MHHCPQWQPCRKPSPRVQLLKYLQKRTWWRTRSSVVSLMGIRLVVLPVTPGVISIWCRNKPRIQAAWCGGQDNGAPGRRSTAARRVRGVMSARWFWTTGWRSAAIWWGCSATFWILCGGALSWKWWSRMLWSAVCRITRWGRWCERLRERDRWGLGVGAPVVGDLEGIRIGTCATVSPRFVGMVVGAKQLHVPNGGNVVNQTRVLTSGRSIHAMVEKCAIMWHFSKELGKMGCVPHEASSRVLHRVHDTWGMA